MSLSHKQVYLRSSTLALLAFSTVFFARTMEALGAPSLINFAHFAFVPVACGFGLCTMRIRDRQQISAIKSMLAALAVFFIVNLISAFLNGAGLINVILSFLLFTEPFMMLMAITSLSLSGDRIQQLKNWVAIFALYNLALVYYQKYAVGVINADYLYGAFFSVAGATVSSIVSLIFAIYFLSSEKTRPLWIRLAVVGAAFWQIIISDTKLVLGSFIIGFILFSISKVNAKSLIYMVFGAFLLLLFFWSLDNVPLLAPYALWINPDEMTNFDSEFYRAKLMAFKQVPEYYSSPIGYIFGLGPGHGVSRLGGWMMEKYSYLLDPIGATHPFLEMRVDIMYDAALESRKVIGTAMYGPLFSWAGLWSDLGIAGVVSYAFIWVTAWRCYCLHDFSRLLVMAILVTGLFPGYLEEPGSLLFTTFVIGLWWHEQRLASRKKRSTLRPATFVTLDTLQSVE